MKKPARRILAQSIGISAGATLTAVGLVALRHALETPQPLKSQLPGESQLYGWRRRSIFYKVLGEVEAPPLLLLHAPGIGASAHEMQQLFEPLARTYRVYAPDLLGFGLSDRPGVEYSAALYSELCQDFLRDVVKQPATLVASELSCNYVVFIASNTPELCSSLVLISPLALHGESQPPFLLKSYVEQPVVKALLYPLLSTRLAFLLTHGPQQRNWMDFARFYAVTHQSGAEHAATALLAGKLHSNAAQLFETLRQPVLVIWGTQALENRSHLASLHNTTQNHRACTVELIQNASLAVHLEQPSSVIAAIQRWQPETALQPPPTEETEGKNTVQPAITDQIFAGSTSATSERQEPFEETQAVTSEEKDRENATGTRRVLEVLESGERANQQSSDFTAANSPQAARLLAYCIKCKKKTVMQSVSEFTMKNGRRAVRGICATCGSSTIRIGGVN